MKLKIELVPSTVWESSLYKLLPRKVWNSIRNMIIKESQKVLEQQGLDVDLRHLLILSDLMCTTGTIQSIGRHGISGSKSSVFARAAFEVTVNQLLDAGLYGEEERLLGIPENVIIGQVCPIGTGRTQIMFDLDANLEILKKKK